MCGVKSQTGKTKIEGLIATTLAIAGVWIIAEGDIRDQLIGEMARVPLEAKRRRRKQRCKDDPGSLFRSASREQSAWLPTVRQELSAASHQIRTNTHINNLSAPTFCAT